jgi:U6 snRNA-associated Sm-like protein LSm6
MENGNLSQGEGKDPSAFLSEIIGNSVTVKLNSGVVYKGTSGDRKAKYIY